MKKEWLDYTKWSRDNDVQIFKKRAKQSLAQLKLWSRHELGDRKKPVDRLMEELRNIKQYHLHYVDGDRIKKLKNGLMPYSSKKKFTGNRSPEQIS